MTSDSDIKTIFHFKEFSMSNSVSAMKISTDSVLLGAWVDVGCVNDAIDVGSGTGLLSLMLAQRGVRSVVGVEIEPEAYAESVHNALHSPWADRIEFIHADIKDLQLPQADLVISNPPYFDMASSGLVSPSESRRLARHETGLSYKWLIENARTTIRSPRGTLAFISPSDREMDIEFLVSLASMGIKRKCVVSPTPRRKAKRILWQLSLEPCPCTVENLTIHDISGEYSARYVQLTQDFYVNF